MLRGYSLPTTRFSSTFGQVTTRMAITGTSVLAFSVTGIAYWKLNQVQQREKERQEQLDLQLKAQASALSKDLILGVLKTDQSLKLVSQLLLTAAKHPDFQKELVAFLKTVFIEDPKGNELLKTFLVDKVIEDPWVKENLLALIANLGKEIGDDSRIYPGMDDGVLLLLKDSATTSLTSDRFNEELWDAISRSLWGVFSNW